MYIDDIGIVLQVVRYDDSSSVVHLFTRSHGRASFMVSRPRSRNSALTALAPLLSPLNVLSFQWNYRRADYLSRMKDAHALYVWRDIPVNPIKTAVVLMLGEFLVHSLREETADVELFDYINASLQWYDAATDDYANFHLVFLLKVLRFLGVAPDRDSLREVYLRRPHASIFNTIHWNGVIPPFEAGWDGEDCIACLLRLQESDYGTMSAFSFSRYDRAYLLEFMEYYYMSHVPGFPLLKSPSVLFSLFG